MAKIGCCVQSGFAPKEGTPFAKYHELINNYNFTVKEVGFDYIEMGVSHILGLSNEEFEMLEKAVNDGIFSCYSTNGYIAEDVDIVGEKASPDIWGQYAERVFSKENRLGIKYAVIGSGGKRRIAEGFPIEKAEKQLFDFFVLTSGIAAKYGINICIEPLNKSETNTINTVAQAYEIAKAVNAPNLGIIADLYHMSYENESPEILLTAKDFIFHMHVAEPNDRKYPGFRRDEYLIKAGEMMRKIGYTGGITAEACFNDFRTESRISLNFMKECFR